jgi:hypothetical protein
MIASQLAILEQGLSYLTHISEEDYTAIISPNFISSAGAHMRHIIDHYQAIITGLEMNLIDYDIRERGCEFESCPRRAIEKLNEISNWIQTLTSNQLRQSITLATEVSIHNKNRQKVQTSVARELVFAGSHAVHHYAMIAQISYAQKNSQPQLFGLAPATATFLRQTGKHTNTEPKGY